MRLSEDKISHISHLLVDGATKEQLVEFSDKTAALKLTKEVITNYCRMDEEVDALVRKKIQSYSRDIPEGSAEWDVLYKKHFREEMGKR